MQQDLLYHYTTPEGLIGIVSNKCIWATDLFYLNDAEELLLGKKLATAHLQELEGKASCQKEQERIQWLKKEISRISPKHHISTYVTSFSSAKDLLSQWRAYCKGGGFALGFKRGPLLNAIESQDFSLDKCVYSEEDQKNQIELMIENVARHFIKTSTNNCEEENSKFVVSSKLHWELTRLASTFKHPSFSEEQEWRLISKPERYLPYRPDHNFFRSGSGMIVPFTKIELPESIWKGLHVVVGPTRHTEESYASVYGLFRRYLGYAIPISHTQTPFRD